VDTFYDSYGQVTEKDEYDFGATTATRKTITTYDTTLGPNIHDRPSVVKVTDGGGNLQAEADYTYDEDIGSLQPSGSAQLTPVTCTGGGKCRGNLTTLKKYVAGSSTVTETFTHYDNGQVYQSTDAKGNVTTYTYGACGNSFLTNVSLPLSLSKSYTWNCYGGVESQANDFNNQPTTFKYNDPMWRLTEIDYADGGKSTATYNDSASPINVVKTELITSALTRTTQTNLDNYGRPNMNKLTSDPEGTTYNSVAYDVVGRTWQVSNPYRGSPTDNPTQTVYDPLGRVKTVTHPDNSVINTTYSQNCTTVTDEANNVRKSCFDGLGRLTQVFEDPNGLNYETDYQYNTRGDLICAVQKGTDTGTFTGCATAPATWRPRSFTYDFLSRLTSATNPESGTISYTYDANGNVLTKVAPTPNKILADTNAPLTVTTTYSYDALNRLTQKSYSDSTTPTVKYGYDGVALSGCTTAPQSLTDKLSCRNADRHVRRIRSHLVEPRHNGANGE